MSVGGMIQRLRTWRQACLKTAGPNLLSWPARPPPNDPSWIWLGTWHAGLFLFMGLSKYGIKQRKLGSVD